MIDVEPEWLSYLVEINVLDKSIKSDRLLSNAFESQNQSLCTKENLSSFLTKKEGGKYASI